MPKVAVVGMGLRVTHMFKCVQEEWPEITLGTVVDPNPDYVRSRFERAKLPLPADLKFVPRIEDLLADAADCDAFMVGTRCHLHAPMASALASLGKPIFLEKPVAISEAQVAQLAQAFAGQMQRVLVSFPLRVTPLLHNVMRIIRSGRLGTISQIQAVNNVSYGGVYFGSWYRNYDQAHGLWLQKATHDFDYLHLLADSTPVQAVGLMSRRVYGGTMPHDLNCTRCDRRQSCNESDIAHRLRGHSGGMTDATVFTKPFDHYCCYSQDIRNQDAGSAIVLYANGLHVNYTQNFVARNTARRRGANIIGHLATLEFDWCSEKIRVVDHMQDRVDQIDVKAATGHSGGDSVLARNFVQMIRGEAQPLGDLSAGLLSAATCLAVKKSCHTRRFEPIAVPGVAAPAEPDLRQVEPLTV